MTDEREPDIIRDRGCANAHPPADGTPDREAIDRFTDFLRFTANGQRDNEGCVGVTGETYRYLIGEDIAPVDVSVLHPVEFWVRTPEARRKAR